MSAPGFPEFPSEDIPAFDVAILAKHGQSRANPQDTAHTAD